MSLISAISMPGAQAMELCYPATEGVVGGWISIWFNIATVVFLSLFGIPGIGRWIWQINFNSTAYMARFPQDGNLH